ncbi:MAG: 5-(carboxyamino)imidazole ribonucleotide mutase [Gemmataceae bacterium]
MSSDPSAIRVAVLMGSKSDWEIMKQAADTLARFGVPHECRVLSAHRTPDELVAYVRQAETRGAQVFIAAAGGAAHLAGVVAAHTTRPVLGVPMPSPLAGGLDSLLAMVQMPAGIPVATFAVGKAGAVNAALFAVSVLALTDSGLAGKVHAYRREQVERILAERLE